MPGSVVLERFPAQPGLRDETSDRLVKKRIYIFPTRHGIVYLFMLMVMLLGAVNYNNSMAYILTFLLGSIFMVSMLHTYRNLRGLIIHLHPARPVFAGDMAIFPLLLDNRPGGKRVNLEFTFKSGRAKQGPAHSKPATVNIPAGELHMTRLELPARERGHLRAGRIRISTTFPSGLLRAWSYIDSDQICTVYPKAEGVRQLPDYSEYTLDEQSGSKTGTDDFAGFKSYRPGESIRNINWKAYAREHGLLVKKFSGSGTDKLIIRWTHCARVKNIEQRLSQLCLWVIEADRQGIYYGLDIPSARIDLNHGENHRHLCLKALAEYGIDAG